jgi:hypothetical protein
MEQMDGYCISNDREETWIVSTRKTADYHLFEADYNWTLGLIFGCRMIHNAEKQDHLNES